MSDLQHIEQIVESILKGTQSSIVILNSQKVQLNQMLVLARNSMQGTVQSSYADILNGLMLAQKKLEYAINCLVEACNSGDEWITNHTNMHHSNSNVDIPYNNTFVDSDMQSEGEYATDSEIPSESDHKLLTPDEVNERWKTTVETTDELINIYKEEMIASGACNGAMLTSFLTLQRSKMLQYEAAVLEFSSGNRGPLNEDEVYQYVLVGENSPYNYSDIVNEFGDYCLEKVSSWVDQINPNPNNDPRREINCGQCAAAVFKRMNGDTVAVAGLGTYSIQEMNNITGKVQTTMSPQQIEDYLKKQGAGSHVVVGVDRASGAGHWFNAFYDGRQIYTIEGQGGYIDGWPPDYGDVVHWDVSI